MKPENCGAKPLFLLNRFFRHQSDARETGGANFRHHIGNQSVIDGFVTAHVNPRLIALSGNRLQARHQHGFLDLCILQKNLPLRID